MIFRAKQTRLCQENMWNRDSPSAQAFPGKERGCLLPVPSPSVSRGRSQEPGTKATLQASENRMSKWLLSGAGSTLLLRAEPLAGPAPHEPPTCVRGEVSREPGAALGPVCRVALSAQLLLLACSQDQGPPSRKENAANRSRKVLVVSTSS